MIKILIPLLLVSLVGSAQYRLKRVALDGANSDTLWVKNNTDSLFRYNGSAYIFATVQKTKVFPTIEEMQGTVTVDWTSGVTNKPSTYTPSTHSHDYSTNEITNKPTIPTNTNQLTNGAGFLVAADISGKQNTLVSGTNIKTINGVPVLGSGDLVVSGVDKGYTISVQALTSSPADGATVYFGMLPKAPVTAAATSKIHIREAGTITAANIYCYSGTAGTNEAWSLYIRINNTTDHLIATVSASTSERIFSKSDFSIAVNAGDYFEIKGIQPTWVTNPLTTIYGGYVLIK